MTKRAQPDASPEKASSPDQGDDTESATAVPATDLNSTVTLSQEALAELLEQVKRAQGARAGDKPTSSTVVPVKPAPGDEGDAGG